jgi:UDP-glucose 4-epimerase
MRDRADPSFYHRANVESTIRLARAAVAAGARRLVYVSSVKAAAERSTRPVREDDRAAPEDAYGRSKRDAEEALWALARETGLEVVVVRPPLVYGPGVAGNFRRLMRVVQLAARVPLPLGTAQAPRSLVYVGNLADALATVALDPRAAGETFYVRDGEDLSTSALVRRLGRALGVRPRLLPVPAGPMRLLAAPLGRRGELDRLFGALQVDDGRLRAQLGWRPPFSVDEALGATARAFLADQAAARGAV